jgi:hypothetical protein
MRFVVALFIGEILVLISWIFVALVEQMLTLRPMDVAGLSLKGLVFALGGSLVGPVVAPVGVTLVPVVALVGATLVEGSTMQVATLVAAIVVSVALTRKMANFVVVALRHLVAEFALCTKLDLLSHFFVREPSAICELKMMSKYLATVASVLSQRRRPLSRYRLQSS